MVVSIEDTAAESRLDICIGEIVRISSSDQFTCSPTFCRQALKKIFLAFSPSVNSSTTRDA
jgi:hypothetical protein